jgi:polyphosphate glucokinase
MTTAIGIDIGGSGVKGARVNVTTGALLSERSKYPTPPGGEPGDILATVRHILQDLDSSGNELMGVCFPAVVRHGVTMSAANVSPDWIGFPAERLFADSLDREVHFINDADAAGFAEAHLGAARNVAGLVIVVTLGTGIGTALISDGVLIPNAELGHLEIDGADAELGASNAAREREGLSFEEWGGRLTSYFSHLEMLLSPDLFVIGGGVSTEHDEFFHHIAVTTPIKPAELFNNAGIVGSALLAALNH